MNKFQVNNKVTEIETGKLWTVNKVFLVVDAIDSTKGDSNYLLSDETGYMEAFEEDKLDSWKNGVNPVIKVGTYVSSTVSGMAYNPKNGVYFDLFIKNKGIVCDVVNKDLCTVTFNGNYNHTTDVYFNQLEIDQEAEAFHKIAETEHEKSEFIDNLMQAGDIVELLWEINCNNGDVIPNGSNFVVQHADIEGFVTFMHDGEEHKLPSALFKVVKESGALFGYSEAYDNGYVAGRKSFQDDMVKAKDDDPVYNMTHDALNDAYEKGWQNAQDGYMEDIQERHAQKFDEPVLSEFSKLVDKVVGERSQSYDGPEQSFSRIAELWSAYLSHSNFYKHEEYLRPEDVALMMVLLKVCRVMNNIGPETMDSVVDIAGYAKTLYEM